MICPSCKSALEDGLRYCLHCGRYLGESQGEERTKAYPTMPPTMASPPRELYSPENKNPQPVVRVKGISTRTGMILIIIIVLIIVIGYLLPYMKRLLG